MRPPFAFYFSLNIREFIQEKTFISIINVNKPLFGWSNHLYNIREVLLGRNALSVASVGEPSG